MKKLFSLLLCVLLMTTIPAACGNDVQDNTNGDAIATDYTTHVYTVTATVEVGGTAHYTNIKLTDGGTSVNLYCSSANQYQWLQAYAGQKITMEIAPCNWNSKDYYTGCVLAVIKADGTKEYNTLNFDN